MKRICLLMILCFSCNFIQAQTFSLGCNCEEEWIGFPSLALVCPFKEELFCNETKLFFQKSKLFSKVKIEFNGEKNFSIDFKLDSLGHFVYYYPRKSFSIVDDTIIDQYVNKVLKHFLWDISTMKVIEFHDNNNIYVLTLWLTVNRKRSVIIATRAIGKYPTPLNSLCQP